MQAPRLSNSGRDRQGLPAMACLPDERPTSWPSSPFLHGGRHAYIEEHRYMQRRLTPLVAFIALVPLVSCLNGSSGDVAPPVTTGPYSAVVTDLKDSTKAPAASIVLVRAHVTHDGIAIPAAAVKFTVAAGHGLLSVDSTSTDTLGVATVLWTLGDTASEVNTLSIVSGDGADSLHVVAIVGSPSYLVPVTTGSNDVAAGAPFAIQVRVTDRPGNPVPGATVFWTTTGGTLAAPSSVSDANGVARATFTSAQPGVFTVSAVIPETATRDFQITVH